MNTQQTLAVSAMLFRDLADRLEEGSLERGEATEQQALFADACFWQIKALLAVAAQETRSMGYFLATAAMRLAEVGSMETEHHGFAEIESRADQLRRIL